MNTKNIILNADSYKASHYLQYPPNTRYVSSYIESRGGKFPRTLFFGLQMFVKEYLNRPFTLEDINEAQEVLSAHGVPFNRAGWEYILKQYNGYLPIQIQSVAEGTLLPVQNVMLQVMNTDSNCAWLTSYIETAILRAIWYPTTVATVSWSVKQIIKQYLEETADTLEGLPFKLHDFGARGASSEETAAIGGAAHLVNFMGSDTVSGIVAARRFYNEPMGAFSIPAAEHSTITAWGRDGESQAYSNMLQQFSGPNKLVAVVSDSFDLWNAIENIWGNTLKDNVINSGGTLVIRPDSGDPVQIVTQTIKRLMNIFGYSTNKKGYRVLPDYLRVIQGDGVSLDSIKAILASMKQNNQSADNIAFGMGGELLQKVNRDTLRFAMKASAVHVENQWKEVYKDPVTDVSKRSKKGRLALVLDGKGQYHTIQKTELNGRRNLLETVYRNGELCKEWSLAQIRERAA